jgi:site-specific DNA-adenine methylase
VSESPILTSIYPGYGAKRDEQEIPGFDGGLRDRIVAELGPHKGFYESCAGSFAVIFGKKRSPMEWCSDLYGDGINLARVLASDRYRELYARIERTMIHSELFEEAQQKLGYADASDVAASVDAVEDRHITRAYWFLVAHWQGINGVTGTHRYNVQLARRFTVGGGHAGTRWDAVGASIPAWHKRLKGVIIDRMSCFDIAPRLADDGTWVIYSDPPYYVKGDQYIYDWTPDMHEQWAGILRAKKNTRSVVSYYDHPEIRRLYEGWTIVDCSKTKSMTSMGRRDGENKSKAPEILLINGPSLTAEGGLWA